MTELRTGSIDRISDARRNAERELQKAVASIPECYDFQPYLSAFMSFACALFDAEAGELLAQYKDAERLENALNNEVTPRIVEGILPDRSFARVQTLRDDEPKRLDIEHEENGSLWELGADGSRRPARKYVQGIFAQHGDWERFAPVPVRFAARWPDFADVIRATLTQGLQRRAFYWVGQNPNSSGTARRGYRSEIRKYMDAKGIPNIRAAAKHFAVSVDTLKSIMSSKGKPRYGKEKLEQVLKKAGVRQPNSPSHSPSPTTPLSR